jgi:hypothetical protein
MSAQGKKHETLSKKMTKVKKGWRCSSSGENLPSVQGPGVSSKPSTAKKKKKGGVAGKNHLGFKFKRGKNYGEIN